VIPALDAGVLYGQGLFETILIKSGQPVLLERHLARMADSASQFQLEAPFPPAEIMLMLKETIAGNVISEGAARITLTAGVNGEAANIVISARKLPYTSGQYARGFAAGFVSFPRNERSPLVGHKTTCFFDNVLARREIAGRGLDEGLFLNTRGELAEGTVSNIFMVVGGKVHTPPPESGLLPGIMRQMALDVCRQRGIAAGERIILPEELQHCREAFITNSLMGVMPLVSIEGQPVGDGKPGELTVAIQNYVFKTNF
jgi:branched-subunit amino acid aminotransferase/4-amino-4-deoxychorismate lyase